MPMPSAFNSYKPKHLRVYGAICVSEHGEVLLVRGTGSQKWSFPKGKCKSWESDLECAKRELLEETGFDIGDKRALSTHKLQGGIYFLFPVENSRDITFSPKNTWEIDAAQWWSLSDLPKGMEGNIDVSIFRTLMRGMKKEPSAALEYIDSPAARRRIGTIRQSMEESAEAKKTTVDPWTSLTPSSSVETDSLNAPAD